jgi:hypothetical protein
VKRSSLFDLSGPARRLWPGEFARQLGARGVSKRTLDAYLKQPGFPKGRLEQVGRIEVRTFSAEDLGHAQVWLAEHGLPGRRAGRERLSGATALHNERRRLAADLSRLGKVAVDHNLHAIARVALLSTLRAYGLTVQ